MKYILYLLSLIFLLQANATEIPSSSSFASTEGLIESLVAGHVCPISGDFVDAETDIVVPGPNPLILRRTYCSSDKNCGILGTGWQLFEPSYLITTKDLESDYTLASAKTASGAHANYRKKVKHRHNKTYQFELVKTKGFTNCGSGLISAKTNLKNNRLSISTGERDDLLGVMTSGNGITKIYQKASEYGQSVYLELIEEKTLHNTLKRFNYGETSIAMTVSNGLFMHTMCFLKNLEVTFF